MAAWIGLAEITRGEIAEIPKPVKKLVIDHSKLRPSVEPKKVKKTFVTPPDEIRAPVASETGLEFVEASIDETTSTIHASFDKVRGWKVTYNYETGEWALIR